MPLALDVFDDFHLHGASAPEWNQRYLQLSAGAMRSRLAEVSTPSVHVFRKWMSERVVQQGCLPPGKLCVAISLGSTRGLLRTQGHALDADRVLVLRGGDDFTLQRPGNLEVLAVTFEAETLHRLLDLRPLPAAARDLLARRVLRAPRPAVQRLGLSLQALQQQPATDESAALPLAFDAVWQLLAEAGGSSPTVSSASAAYIVAECHRIVAASGDRPPDIDTLCQRLHTSRRSLQNAFRQVADTTPVHYLRSLRLNAVRSRLMATPVAAPTVSQAASDQGFDHLSHFTERYRALFEERPSATCRAVTSFAKASDGGIRNDSKH